MGIDINLLRPERGGDIEAVRKSELARGRDGLIIDQILKVDTDWRKAIFNVEQKKRDCNAASKEIGKCKKSGAPCEDLIAQSSQLKLEIPQLEAKAEETAKLRDSLLHKIGNIVHPSVRVAQDEAENRVLKVYGPPAKLRIEGVPNGLLHHHEIIARLGGLETKKGVEAAGHRGYFLKGVGYMLNAALVQYGINFLIRKGYIPVQPPYFMRKTVMSETAELADFEETLYRIPVDEGKDERDDLFLIATSEQPLSALHRGEHIEESQLPIRYGGVSSCFRKEAGSHGKDTWGLFRIHQFEKVEQFCIAKPDESEKIHNEMLETAEEFYQSLDLPFRLVEIVSGALNDAASRKVDLEAWFPGYERYRELVSCSNCTDYQSRALGIRLGHKTLPDSEKKHVHLLNGTLVAAQRCLCCILENYQTANGVLVPQALIPYMGGLEFMKYVNPS